MHLLPKLVLTEPDALIMRAIRNECREWMTNNRDEISIEAQLEWFRGLDRNEVLPWLFKGELSHVAYGIMRLRDHKWWLSVGVKAQLRGLGYGTEAFEYMTGLVEEAWLEVRLDNLIAKQVYQELGYQIVETQPDRVIMVHR